MISLRISLTLVAACAMAVAVAVAASQMADAASPKPGRINRTVELTAAKAGKRIAAEGAASIKVRRGEGLQEFEVDIETISDATGKPVRGTEGMRLRVFLTNSARPYRGRTILAGAFAIDKTGHGLLQFSSDPVHRQEEGARRLKRGVRPVTGIETVTVKNSAGRVVLRGRF